MEQVCRAIHDGDWQAFVGALQREPWLLGDDCVRFQAGLIERATLQDRGSSLPRCSSSIPRSCGASRRPRRRPIEFAFMYAKPHLIPVAHSHLATARRSAARRRHGQTWRG